MIDGPVIQVASGEYIEPMAPWHFTPRIEDIAHALSNQCRFSGHTRRHYSVAEHSCRVSDIVADDQKLGALLHDASEYALVDLPTPLKMHPLIGDPYRMIEEALQSRIDDHFGVDSHTQEIRRADRVLLATERRDLMPRDGQPWLILDGVVPLEETIRPWSPEFAKVSFLRRYYALAPFAVAA